MAFSSRSRKVLTVSVAAAAALALAGCGAGKNDNDTIVPFAEPRNPVTERKPRIKPAAKQGLAQ